MTAEELLRETIREKHEFHETEMEHLREEHRAVVRHLKRDHKNTADVAAAEHEQLRIELESCLEGAAWLVEGLKEQQTEAKAASEFWAADATGLHEQELRALRAEGCVALEGELAAALQVGLVVCVTLSASGDGRGAVV